MSEVITLSSDDEDIVQKSPERKIKRIKLTPVVISRGIIQLSTDMNALINTNNLGFHQISPLLSQTSKDETIKDDEDDVILINENDVENPKKNSDANSWKISTITTLKEHGNNKITKPLAKQDQRQMNQSSISDEIIFSLGTSETSTIKEVDNKSEDSSDLMCPNLEEFGEPSTSDISDSEYSFQTFLAACSKSIRDSLYEAKITAKLDKIKSFFKSCNNIHNDFGLMKLIEQNTTKARISALDAVVAFQQIYSQLKETSNDEICEVEEKNLSKIKQLEKASRLVLRKLKKLDETPVNWDDEENSHYIQRDRYTQRLVKIHTKYCQLLGKNPYSGRLTHEKLKYTTSKHEQINKALNKIYKNGEFPCYADVESCIRKCVEKFDVKITENEIKSEAKHCFTTMGNILQMRRKRELYESHSAFVELKVDPALEDPLLQTELQKSSNEREEKLKKIVEKFAHLQEAKIEPELSEDSDDSNHNSDNN